MILSSCPDCGDKRMVRNDKYGVPCLKCSHIRRRKRPEGYEILSKKEFFEKFGKRKSGAMILFPCKQCGEKYWRALSDLRRKTSKKLCRKCYNEFMSITRGDDRWNWKNGARQKWGNGYIVIRIPKTDSFFCMTMAGQMVLEHRYNMAKHLGRVLNRWELVHHKNCIKDDNRIENLQLVVLKSHHGELVCPHCGKPYNVQ